MLNPSDLRSFLILIFTGVQLRDSSSNVSTEEFGQAKTIINPVAMSQFFEATCVTIFKRFLAARSTKSRLLGPVSTYYGIVEINSQRILHLHFFVWLCRAFYLAELRSRLLSDLKYTTDIVNFIDSIIRCLMVDISASKNTCQEVPSTSVNKSDQEFALTLYDDSNFVASKTQIHSFSYYATCFKCRATVNRKCWFDFPRPHINKTRVTELVSINISRNHLWVNPWNLALASITRLNHNIHFIPSNIKALSLVCYITNYATDRACSQYHHVMVAAFL